MAATPVPANEMVELLFRAKVLPPKFKLNSLPFATEALPPLVAPPKALAAVAIKVPSFVIDVPPL